MQKSDSNKPIKNARRQVQTSTTLSRKYVSRPLAKVNSSPNPIKTSPAIKHFHNPTQTSVMSDVKMKTMQNPSESKRPSVSLNKTANVTPHPIQKKTACRMCIRKKSLASTPQKPSAKELKDAAIKKALASAATTPEMNNNQSSEKTAKKLRGKNKIQFGFGRVFLALSCAAAAVFAIVYFVNLNAPDVSLKVAAMQTGIEASYPNYVPRDFSLTDITSEEGKITLNFKNTTSDSSFSLIEEQSSWDSNALLNNFVKEEYGENYSTIKEQGLTIYISGSNATWVNGGKIFKIKTTAGSLTKKQITSIAASL